MWILDQRLSWRSFIGWQTSFGDFVVPVRSELASLRPGANDGCRTHQAGPVNGGRSQAPMAMAKSLAHGPHEPDPCLKSRTIAESFLRLDPTLLDRVGRYEARLWRQAAQTIWTLDAMRRPQPASERRPARKPVARFYWDAER
jgi:hypothetical protein